MQGDIANLTHQAVQLQSNINTAASQLDNQQAPSENTQLLQTREELQAKLAIQEGEIYAELAEGNMLKTQLPSADQ